MSNATRDTNTNGKSQAIGLIATEANLGRLARRIVQANGRGYKSLVTYERGMNLDQLRFVEQLGGSLIHPDGVVEGRNELCRKLESEAERLNYRIVLSGDGPDLFRGDHTLVATEDALASTVDATASVAQDREDKVATTETIVAIPAYNEAQTIGDVVRRAKPFTDEVIVVDDGSSDSTVSVAREAGATVVEHVENRGYGAALRTAFREAYRRNATQLVTLDADGQHDPRDIPKLLNSQKKLDVEVVVGSRFVDDGSCDAPLYRLFGLRVINLLTNLSLGVVRSDSWVTDTQSGFRAYDERAIKTLATDRTIGESMSASTDILYHAHRHGYSIKEAGIDVSYDVDSPSSVNPLVHGLTLVTNILNTVERERPLLTFGLPGLLLILFGISFTLVATMGYITTVPPLGLTITSITVTMVGIFSCFTALILHSVAGLLEREQYERQDDYHQDTIFPR
ncbi:Glycosyl transferase family 2 [Halogranum rubrum]|uniref:Glycosyl transferase family 2 n=1 Tax=Halogranum rubrum TaxID=553466 RepID=A0A1I4JFI4_9EURY|nr:glycosyltransferase family 2 protein [Halogranum rubrum]SFL65310.1 Glycosyl transferase family 2 [Halogranum rubrum]